MFTPRRTTPFLLASLAAAACGGGGGSDNTGGGTTPPTPPVTPTSSQYVNPVLNSDFPDPGIVKGAADGAYYAYATQTTGIRIQVARSTDLVTWSTPAEALSRPAWASQSQNFWAPDVNLRENNTYVMYFSAQADSTNGGFCVGMATSTSPAGPFTDVGHPVVCGRDGYNIDPQGFDDPQPGGQHYLLWGSGGSIQIRQLSATDRSVFAAGSASVTTAQRRSNDPYEQVLVEGAWMQYHAGSASPYYLFYSAGNCCNQFGAPHYAVMVARAPSPTGPFEFHRASDGTAIPVVAAGTNSRFIAPGHNSVVTVGGSDYMVYHAIDTNNPILAGTSTVSRRPLLVDKITYQADGWPVVGTAGVPTSTPQTKPGQ